jgi:hypothetical protein
VLINLKRVSIAVNVYGIAHGAESAVSQPPTRYRVFGRESEAERDGNPEFGHGEDLTADYHDLAVAVQGLGFLESGITDPLNHFSNTLLEFSALLRHTVRSAPEITRLAFMK